MIALLFLRRVPSDLIPEKIKALFFSNVPLQMLLVYFLKTRLILIIETKCFIIHIIHHSSSAFEPFKIDFYKYSSIETVRSNIINI